MGRRAGRTVLSRKRTDFLAWIRTALALLAGGVALELLGLDLHPGLRLAASLVLIVTGLVVPLAAGVGWMQNERALRTGMPLTASILGVLLAVAVSISGVLLVLGITL